MSAFILLRIFVKYHIRGIYQSPSTHPVFFKIVLGLKTFYFHPKDTKSNLHSLSTLSSCRAVNTTRIGYDESTSGV